MNGPGSNEFLCVLLKLTGYRERIPGTDKRLEGLFSPLILYHVIVIVSVSLTEILSICFTAIPHNVEDNTRSVKSVPSQCNKSSLAQINKVQLLPAYQCLCDKGLLPINKWLS